MLWRNQCFDPFGFAIDILYNGQNTLKVFKWIPVHADLPEFYISSVVAGELYNGVNRVANKAKHLKQLNEFLKLCTVLDVDGKTASHYGEMVAKLFKKGKPIPTNDIRIAATAKQHNLTLVTRDKHFNGIDTLGIKNW